MDRIELSLVACEKTSFVGLR